MSGPDELQAQLSAVVAFLGQAPLKSTVADLELALAGCAQADVGRVITAHGIDRGLLASAVAARDSFGKINDVIHAVAIALCLERLLGHDEKLKRPSLAAGNTPDRLYDVETDRRVAEFKFARWDGHDGGRQKTTIKDLARLAADSSGRIAELYVLGERPVTWLTTTRSPIRAKLKFYPAELAAFESVFGDADVPISEFVTGPGSHVSVVNLEQQFPDLFS